MSDFELEIDSIEEPSPPDRQFRWILVSSACTGIIKNYESHIIHTWRTKTGNEL